MLRCTKITDISLQYALTNNTIIRIKNDLKPQYFQTKRLVCAFAPKLTVTVELDLIVLAGFARFGGTLQSVGGTDHILSLTLVVQTSSCHGAPHSNDVITGVWVSQNTSGYFHIRWKI